MRYLNFLEESSLLSVLSLLQLGFMVWMLVDCQRRRVEQTWFWIILWVPVLGAWVYFFNFKARELRGVGALHLWPFHSRPSLKELRYRAEQSPTLANHVNLADRLIEQGSYAEAIPHLEAALKREPDYCQALYGLALCHAKLQEPAKALPLLEKVLARDRRWSNYQAWYLLRDVRLAAGNAEGALTTCQELFQLAPTLQHRCLLAEQLLQLKRTAEAGEILQKGLDEYAFAHWASRRRNRPWASEARRLQKQIRQLPR
jgi:hypothetical protein